MPLYLDAMRTFFCVLWPTNRVDGDTLPSSAPLELLELVALLEWWDDRLDLPALLVLLGRSLSEESSPDVVEWDGIFGNAELICRRLVSDVLMVDREYERKHPRHFLRMGCVVVFNPTNDVFLLPHRGHSWEGPVWPKAEKSGGGGGLDKKASSTCGKLALPELDINVSSACATYSYWLVFKGGSSLFLFSFRCFFRFFFLPPEIFIFCLCLSLLCCSLTLEAVEVEDHFISAPSEEEDEEEEEEEEEEDKEDKEEEEEADCFLWLFMGNCRPNEMASAFWISLALKSGNPALCMIFLGARLDRRTPFVGGFFCPVPD